MLYVYVVCILCEYGVCIKILVRLEFSLTSSVPRYPYVKHSQAGDIFINDMGGVRERDSEREGERGGGMRGREGERCKVLY